MRKLRAIYMIAFTFLAVTSCKQTKNVPQGKYLLDNNDIRVTGDKLDKEELFSIIRQQPNFKSLGVKWKLMAYNSVDSAKVAEKRQRLDIKIRETNKERLAKQDRINSKRIAKAKKKGKTFYSHKTVNLKDTIEPRKFLREWYKYKVGRAPVVFDSIPYEKTLEQMNTYLRNKGYYYGAVEGIVNYHENSKCDVTYHLISGDRYFIDSVYYRTNNYEVDIAYKEFISLQDDPPLVGKPFDVDLLDSYRSKVARYMRDSSFYGFNANHVKFIVDTTYGDMKVKVGVELNDKVIVLKDQKDSIIVMDHCKSYIDEVIYHIADSNLYKGNFADTLMLRGIPLYAGQFMTTIDTMYYPELSGKDYDAIFLYNGELFVRPRVLQMFNEQVKGEYYSEKNVENTYNGLLRLGLFSVIKVQMEEIYETNQLIAHYYLVPSKKQSYGFEPRATNSNGYLGVSASVYYVNRNLFKGAEKLTVSLTGGFESQPAVFDETVEGQKIKTASRSFNTFEIGPSVKLEIPGFFPIRWTRLAERSKPQTIISTAYNLQDRADFTRHIYQMNFLWRFVNSKTTIFQAGFPGVSVFKIVNIDKTDNFTDKLNTLNDLFLISAYSNQFVWQDWRFTFEYNIKNKPGRRKNFQLVVNSSFDPAGNIASLFRNYQDTLANGSYAIQGLQYSQFIRTDHELIYSKPFRNERSINFKLNIGGGLPYGNSTTTMPYDYAFFAGGANDIRGWRARSLGPGSYKYYLDTNHTATQIGDIRIGGSTEARFPITGLFKGAFFVDAGNIWSVFDDAKRPGGKFTSTWYNDLAVAAGFGIRVDFEYFIVRLDLGFPVRNPALPVGSKWVFQSRKEYYDEAEAFFGSDYQKYIPKPFTPVPQFGIGFPF